MSTNQELRQESVRAVTGTTGTYNEDFLALFASAGFTTGTFNERFYLWLEDRLGLTNSGKTLNELMVDFAIDQGVSDWNSLGTITLGTLLQLLQGNLLLTGHAPSIAIQAGLMAGPQAGNLLLAGAAPTLVLSDNLIIAPMQGNVLLSGAAPTLAKTDFHIVAPTQGNIALSGFAPVANPAPSIVAGSISTAALIGTSASARTYFSPYTAGAGSNRKVIVVFVCEDAGNNDASESCTWGGVDGISIPYVKRDGAASDVTIIGYYWDEAFFPASATGNIIADMVDNENHSAMVFTVQDAMPGPFVDCLPAGVGTDTSPATLDLTTSFDKSLLLTILGIGEEITDVAAAGTGHTVVTDFDSNQGERIVLGKIDAATAGAYTLSYTFSNSAAAGISFAIAPVGAYTPFTVYPATKTAFATPATAHAVSMPATVNSGDLLKVWFGTFALATNPAPAITTPSGWTLDRTVDNVNTTNSRTLALYKKSADGTEGGTTVDFATASNVTAAAICRRIPTGQWSGTLTDIEVTATVNSVGNSTTPNPPSITPSWGPERALAFCVTAGADDDIHIRLASAGYFGKASVVSGAGANAGASVADCFAMFTGALEDPGTMTMLGQDDFLTHTVAIRKGA